MSLLMDALKKAEREREAQASKEEGEAGESSQELSLDPMDEPPADDEAAVEAAAQETAEEEPWDVLGAEDEDDKSFDLDLDAGAGAGAIAEEACYR